MPKPMLRQPQTQQQSNTILSATQTQQQSKQTQKMDKMKLDRLLRKTRSKEYMQAMHKLDAGGHVRNQHKVNEIVDDAYPNLDLDIDPKLAWALRHPEIFPIDINRADYEMLLRVPGIGIKSAKLIVVSRRYSRLGASQLKKIGVVMKKAQYFITCNELPMQTVNEMNPQNIRKLLVGRPRTKDSRQLTLSFED